MFLIAPNVRNGGELMHDEIDTILSMTPAMAPVWAQFVTEDGEDRWSGRVHVWAHIKTGWTRDEKDTHAFLGNDIAEDRFRVEGMILWDGPDLVLVSETESVFLQYSETEEDESITPAQIKTACANQRRKWLKGRDDEPASK